MTDAERRRLFDAERRRIERAMLAHSTGTMRAVLQLLRDAQALVRAVLHVKEAAQLSSTTATRRIDSALMQFRKGTAGVWADAIARAWRMGIALIDKPLAAAGVPIDQSVRVLREASVGSDIKGVSERQLAAMQKFMADRIADITTEARAAIKVQLQLAVSGAQSVSDTIANVDQILGGNARRRASTITNTEINRAFAMASYERLLDAQKRVPGLKKQWRRSGKIHSRIEHDLIDGQVRPVNEPFQVGGETLRYPRDPEGSAKNTINCGCKILPWMDSWQVKDKGPRPFTPEEIARNPIRAELNDAIEKAGDAAPTPAATAAPSIEPAAPTPSVELPPTPATSPTPPAPAPVLVEAPTVRPVPNELIEQIRGTQIPTEPITHGPLDIPIVQSMGGLRQAQAATLRVEEFLLVRKKREHAVVVATDGTLIARRGGGVNSVSFTEEETGRMFGAVLSHNHPSGFSFSIDDIRFAATHGLAEIRVYTRRHLYRLRAPDGGWSPQWVQATLLPAVRAAQSVVAPIAIAEARRRGLKRHARNQLAQDLLVRYLAKQLRLRLQVITP